MIKNLAFESPKHTSFTKARLRLPSIARSALVLKLMAKIFFLPGTDGLTALRQSFLSELVKTSEVTFAHPPLRKINSYNELVKSYQDQMPKTGAVILIAESMSGPAAVSLAMANASQVKGICFVSSFVKFPYPAAPIHLLSKIPVSLIPNFAVKFATGSNKLNQFELSEAMRKIAAMDQRVLRSRLTSVASADTLAAYGKLDIPILWIHGRRDRAVRYSEAKRQASANKAARFKDIEAGHFAILESSQKIAAICREFIASVE